MAIVAVSKHVPKLDAVIVALLVAFERVQPVAVPPLLIANVIAPLPRLSAVVIDSAYEYG